MSSHHDEHHSTENKPVSFTVPFILACVTLVLVVSFLSLCDPKKGHHGECEDKENCTKECKEGHGKEGHEMKESEAKEAAVATAEVTTDTTAKAEEPAKAEEAHH